MSGHFNTNMLVVICAFIGILFSFLRMQSRKPVNFPPGPTPIPVIGNLNIFARESNILELFRNLRKIYGGVSVFVLVNT